MQKQSRHNFSPIHMNLLEQFQNLFNRRNLCSNNYLYRQINQNLQIPLNFLTEERRIAQITNNIQTIQEALQMCNLVQVVSQKTVKVIQYPTLKISNLHRKEIEEFCKLLQQKNRKIVLYEEDNLIYLSLIEKKSVKQLELVLNQFNNFQYQVADLQTDWKAGTAKIRKLKQQNKKNFKNQKYSFDKPPGIFIRRAVQSSEDEQETVNKKFQNNNKQQQKQRQKQKKYREKPVINEEDFPTLS